MLLCCDIKCVFFQRVHCNNCSVMMMVKLVLTVVMIALTRETIRLSSQISADGLNVQKI